jgi:SAM-dependent methyltransferase
MSEDDRDRWNRKYRGGGHQSAEPSSFLVASADWLPAAGRALDVAGGAGRHAVWLADRGFDVTLVDVADEALALARRRADAAGVRLDTVRRDLEREPLPAGPWDVILCFHYLSRPLFARFGELLAPGGRLLFCQPTVRNLERHPRPGRRFLLDEGEARQLVEAAGLAVLQLEEGWSDGGRHEARVVAGAPT